MEAVEQQGMQLSSIFKEMLRFNNCDVGVMFKEMLRCSICELFLNVTYCELQI